jgi:TRAP-type C4-dicarboxylate transport system permease small subunit
VTVFARGAAAVRQLEDTIGIVLFAAMLVVVVAQVFVRFLLYHWVQIAWADEIGRALLVWSSFWGAVLVTRESQHITVDLLYDRLPPAGRCLLRIVGDLLMGAFLLLVVSTGLPIFLDSLRRPSPATNLPFVIFDGALWTSGVLMIAHIAANAFSSWRREASPGSELSSDPI